MKNKWFSFSLALCLMLTLLSTAFFSNASAEWYGDLLYEIWNDEVSIIGTAKTASGVIVIPDTIEGLPVTSISQDAFGPSQEYVHDEDGDHLVTYYKDITDVVFSDNLVYIWRSAFKNSELYKNPDNWENGVLYVNRTLIATREDVTSVTVRPGTKWIACNAFEDCDQLVSVTFSDSVEFVGAYAFSDCTSFVALTVDI